MNRLIPTFWASERRLTPIDLPSTAYFLPLTIYQLPSTIYQLPAFPGYKVLKKKELREEQATICGADYRLDGGEAKLPAGYFNQAYNQQRGQAFWSGPAPTLISSQQHSTRSEKPV